MQDVTAAKLLSPNVLCVRGMAHDPSVDKQSANCGSSVLYCVLCFYCVLLLFGLFGYYYFINICCCLWPSKTNWISSAKYRGARQDKGCLVA